MARRYNNRKIIDTQQTLPLNKILPGMIVTFNYSEQGVTDPRPLLLFMHYNKDNKVLEGLNMNYINPAKLKSYFLLLNLKKVNLMNKKIY